MTPTQAVLTVIEVHVAEYRVMARDSISDLEIIVNQMLGYGWQPYGALITIHGFWYQAMVKFAEKDASLGEPA